MFLPFTGRDAQWIQGKAFLGIPYLGAEPRLLVLTGESGTGKTELYKKIARDLLLEDTNCLSLYLDLADDDFFLSKFFECLALLSLNPREASEHDPTQVPSGGTFQDFLSRKKLTGGALSVIKGALTVVADLISAPVAKALSPLWEAVPRSPGMDHDVDLETLFWEFLDREARARPIYLCLDNYQFLGAGARLSFEAKVQQIKRNLGITLIVRAQDPEGIEAGAESIEPGWSVPDSKHTVSLLPFTEEEVKSLVNRLYDHTEVRKDAVARACFHYTRGNLKEIEIFLRNYRLDKNGAFIEPDTHDLLALIAELPRESRGLLSLATLFPAGLKPRFVSAILSEHVGLQDEERIQDLVQDMVTMGLLVVNGERRGLVRPAHEKVVISTRQILTDSEMVQLRTSALRALENLVSVTHAASDYVYLLHCLVGLMDVSYARGRIFQIAQLIDLQYEAESYSYIVAVGKEFQDILEIFPRTTLVRVLDAVQRCSEFYFGLAMIARLRPAEALRNEELALAEAKFLMQIYRYEEALDLLDELPRSGKVDMYRVMALQYVSRDEEARREVRRVAKREVLSDSEGIILRNAAHLFGAADAIDHLNKAKEHFSQRGSVFGLATACNNMGIVEVWRNRVDEAERLFEEARQRLESLGSNEVYQPLLNLGVVCGIRQRWDLALDRFEESRRWIPKPLLLDQLVLEANRVAARYLGELVPLEELQARMLDILTRGRKLPNPRLQRQLSFVAYCLGLPLSDMSPAVEVARYAEQLAASTTTRFEVIVHQEEASERECLLVLSPHWRF